MSELFFRINGIQKKMDANENLQSIMKEIGALIVFVIFLCTLNNPGTMKIAWLLTLPFIGLLFAFNVYYIRQNKKYELEIYRLETEDLEKKKRIAEIRGEVLPDNLLEREIIKPSEVVSLPIPYYVILLVLDILIKVFLIH